MIYTAKEYAEKFTFGGKKVSPKTIINRILAGQLPSNHIAYKVKINRGMWIIEVVDK